MTTCQLDVATLLGATVIESSYRVEQVTVRTDAAGVVHVIGEIDSFSAPRLRSELEALPATGRPVVLDLSRVGFLGSAGLRELIDLRERLDGRLSILAASRAVMRVLEATGQSRRFTFTREQ